MLRVLLLTRYARTAASSRIRYYQYLDHLRARGIQVAAVPLLDDRYVARRLKDGRRSLGSIWRGYWRRLGAVLRSRRYDLLWIQSELFPWLPAWGERLLSAAGVPYVVEYDDALFHRYEEARPRVVRAVVGKKLDTVMRRSSLVIAGNEYLAERARRAGASRVECLPSVVDLARYEVAPVEGRGDGLTIGWIGSRWTVGYLEPCVPALRAVCDRPGVRVVVVGARPAFDGLPVETRAWSEATEVAEIQRFDVGVMPLREGPWEQGKCGYKLIQYMACGKPVVASPVGVNRQIVRHGETGYLAETCSEWVKALIALRDDPRLRARLGTAGRRLVEQQYCVQVTVDRLQHALRQATRPARSPSVV